MIGASATWHEASALALAALAPEMVVLRPGAAQVNENIEHLYVVCEQRDKPDLLRRLWHALEPRGAIVFVHRNETAERVAATLSHHGIAAADLHAASDKRDRQRAMDAFRRGEVRVLIASDLAARGLDLAGVTHIFNLDVPTESRAYLHRVGRTARAGGSGVAVTLMTEPETRRVRRYEQELGIAMQRVRLREGRVLAAGAPEGGPPAARTRQPRPARPATKRA
jgi:superfamily II DNA/RNA helicase